MGPPPDLGQLKKAIDILEKTIASANKVLGRKPAQWAVNKSRRKSLTKRRNMSQKVLDRAYALIDKMEKEAKQPQIARMAVVTAVPQTFSTPDAPPEEIDLAVVDVSTDLALPPPLPEPESFVSRHPILVGLGVLAGAGAVIGGVYYFTRDEG